jgi:predicted DNA-binding transcriptional regulator AlpA
MPTAQEEFDKTYITSREICQYLNINRSTIVQGKQRGLLPEPILIDGGSGQVQLWKRSEVMPYLDAWRINLKARRGELRA